MLHMLINFDKNVTLLNIQLGLYEYFQGKILRYPSDSLLFSSVGLQSVQWNENQILCLWQMEY